VLNEHPPFAQELRCLAQAVASLSLPNTRTLLRVMGIAVPYWEERPNSGAFEELPKPFQLMLRIFAAKWRLPRVSEPQHWHDASLGAREAWHSIEHVLYGTPPENVSLSTGWIGFFEPETAVTISAPSFPPFVYDPSEHAPAALRAVAKLAAPSDRTAILAQGKSAEAATRAAGWRPIANRYRHEGQLRRGAVRLFRYAVLGMSYARIAGVESLENAEGIEPSPLRKSVRAWAADLGIPLPHRVGGRPSNRNP
jgi:hypothetical protein